MHMEKEIWMPVLDYEDLYVVSNYGVIKRLPKKYSTPNVRVLSCGKNKGGYLIACLRKDKIPKSYYVHRLVWEAFNGPIPEGMQVNHINEDKTDNRLDNLNLLSQKENLNWGTRNKRIRLTRRNRRPIAQYTLSGELVKIWSSAWEIHRETGFWQSSIVKCCQHSKWSKSAHGYRWEYSN